MFDVKEITLDDDQRQLYDLKLLIRKFNVVSAEQTMKVVKIAKRRRID